MTTMPMSQLDWGIIAVYLVAVVGLGVAALGYVAGGLLARIL